MELRLVGLAVISLSLIGCGGGGGGVTVTQPAQAVLANYDYTQGTASNYTDAYNTLTTGTAATLPYTSPSSVSYSSTQAANTALNGSGGLPIATQDTRANEAWQEGWTGKDVKVGIVDEFNSNGQIDTHGDWVSIVVSSVAPESNLGLQNYQRSTLAATVTAIGNAYDSLEAGGYFIVNNSWGFDKAERTSTGAYTGNLVAGYDALVSQTVQGIIDNPSTDSYDSNMLFVYAAGNGAQYCGSVYVNDCNFFASLVDGLRDAGLSGGNRIMFVGSVKDDSDTIADYSYRAGTLKNDFIVANDDILGPGDAGGTSFAAPRVVGAAALLRQKFPNLDAAALKQVLLQTATDLGEPGVDSIYGFGKLNVMNALSPQGKVYAK